MHVPISQTSERAAKRGVNRIDLCLLSISSNTEIVQLGFFVQIKHQNFHRHLFVPATIQH